MVGFVLVDTSLSSPSMIDGDVVNQRFVSLKETGTLVDLPYSTSILFERHSLVFAETGSNMGKRREKGEPKHRR